MRLCEHHRKLKSRSAIFDFCAYFRFRLCFSNQHFRFRWQELKQLQYCRWRGNCCRNQGKLGFLKKFTSINTYCLKFAEPEVGPKQEVTQNRKLVKTGSRISISSSVGSRWSNFNIVGGGELLYKFKAKYVVIELNFLNKSHIFPKCGFTLEGTFDFGPIAKKSAKSLPWAKIWISVLNSQRSNLAPLVGNKTEVKTISEIKPPFETIFWNYVFILNLPKRQI